jgi:hypothetical protein
VTAQRVTVPVPAETGVEDRLAGALTFRHAAYLAVAAAGVAVMLLGDRSVARLLVGALAAVIGLAGAMLRPYGEPLDRLAPAAVAFLRRRRADRRVMSGNAEDAADAEPVEPAAPVDRVEPAEPVEPAVSDDGARRSTWRFPIRAAAVVASVAAVAAVAAIRWPHPQPAPPPQVVIVQVPFEVIDPWEEAIDDALDAWVDDLGH